MLYLFGGNANNGVIDGVFYTNLNNPFSNVNSNIATGLSCVYVLHINTNTSPLGEKLVAR